MENMAIAIDNSQMIHEHKLLTCPSSQYCYWRCESSNKKHALLKMKHLIKR